MKTPEILKKGYTIAIISLAGRCEKKYLKLAKDLFESWGLKVKTGKYIFDYYHQFSATDQKRAQDFNSMLYDKEVKAIISLRGGYGSIRILKDIDFDYLKRNPKWIIGFSDISAIHLAVLIKSEISTIHGIMPVNLETATKKSIKSLKTALFGKQLNYKFKSNYLNRVGEVSGEIIGGNLSVLYSLRGTEYDISMENKILFIEDLNEYLYHIDRMMQNFKLGGKLKNLKALIVGSFSDIQDNRIQFGKNTYEIIYDAVKEYNYPVIFNFPAGHIKNNNTLIFGKTTKLKVSKEYTEILF